MARLASLAMTVVAVIMSTQLPAAAQGQGVQVTICHRTGSASNPWVFMMIDARTWPERQAEGDIQATSLADCPQPTVVPAVASTVAPLPSPTSLPSEPAAQQQPIAPGTAILTVPVADLRGVATPAPTTATPSTPAQTLEVAGVRAEPVTDTPEISTLPKSGGEPDRGLLVVGLLAVAAMGMALRRLARRRF